VDGIRCTGYVTNGTGPKSDEDGKPTTAICPRFHSTTRQRKKGYHKKGRRPDEGVPGSVEETCSEPALSDRTKSLRKREEEEAIGDPKEEKIFSRTSQSGLHPLVLSRVGSKLCRSRQKNLIKICNARKGKAQGRAPPCAISSDYPHACRHLEKNGKS